MVPGSDGALCVLRWIEGVQEVQQVGKMTRELTDGQRAKGNHVAECCLRT